MFGFIRKTKVLEIIENGQKQLRDVENEILLTSDKCDSEEEIRDYLVSLGRLQGGVYFLEGLKKHFL